ncbi:uncharacterized protein KIAA0754 homolog [Ochotona curzoniae]|uniref:uncharacterized protein KIAA0754 homolog n=1 Tax=Ochotona curzoniae TaxID=130825 RepID=UPI001B347909|nr:uncharacterized protein KIAA0754 homolog [Ochotona curzoniae]
MGKPLSRPDCLRRNPTCLGKGEEEDGYIEDCYVPQRSIYDTMRINEQIDQGSKLNQTSKSTMEKLEGSTISSNGTLGAASNVFESRAPEGKKLDERIIFDALKLSSDVQKSAPAPPRRRPNAERRDNVNRRSWKSFMPPNFPEFAERMEASLSEVSEVGASNPSLQEKKESKSVLTASSGQLDQRAPRAEAVTLQHVSKSVGVSEVQDVKNLSGDCQDLRFQQHSESSPYQFLPAESEAPAASANTDVTQEHRFSSATWPRAMKSSAKGSFGEKQHPLGETACAVEIPPLSPCLSEELLDPELNILVIPTLREKTESELKFEEDERWIMMEAEEDWEEEKLSETGKTSLMANENNLTDTGEKEPTDTTAVAEDEADSLAAASGVLGHPDLDQISCCDNPQPSQDQLASVPRDTPLDHSYVLTGEMEDRTPRGLESPVGAEQLSDTDSVQMFLELEKECLCEEVVTPPAELQNQASAEWLAPSQDAENSSVISHFPGAPSEKGQHVGLLNVSKKDYAVGLDCEYFSALDSSQVPNAVELTASDASTVNKEECEKVPFSPTAAGEFKSSNPADLESLGMQDSGELPNPDHLASHDDLSGFIASELAKENGNLSQVDCSQTKRNVKKHIGSPPLSFAFNHELTDVTSRPEAEVLSYDSRFLTDEMCLKSEKGAINPENSSVASLGNVDLCELCVEKVFDEAEELDCQAKLLEDGAPTHSHKDSPEQVPDSLQSKSPESDVLVRELRHGDGVGTVIDRKPELNVASWGGTSLQNILPGEQATKSSNSESVLEERMPILQGLAPTATVPTLEENVLLAAVSEPQGTAVAAALVPFPKEDIPAAFVVPTENVTVAAVSAPEGTASAAPVPITKEDDTPEKPATPTASVPVLEEPTTPTASVPVREEPTTPIPAAAATSEKYPAPAAAVPTPEKPDAPAPAATTAPQEPAAPSVSAPQEPTAPTLSVPILEESRILAIAVLTPEEPVAPALETPLSPKEPATPASAAPLSPEEPVALAPALLTPEEPATPAPAAPSSPRDPATPASAALPIPEEPATPASAVPLSPRDPATPASAALPIPEEPATSAPAAPLSPEEPATPAAVTPTPGKPTASAPAPPSSSEEPAILNSAVPTPEEPVAPAPAVPSSPEEPVAPAPAVPSSPEEPVAPAPAALSSPEEPAITDAAVPTPGELATPVPTVPLSPEEPAASAPTVPTTGEPVASAPAAVSAPQKPASLAAIVLAPEGPAAPAVAALSTPKDPAAPAAAAVFAPLESGFLAATVLTPEGHAIPAAEVPTPEDPAAPVAAVPSVEESNCPAGTPFLGDTAHTESVPILEEGTPVLERIKEDLDSSAFGLKEVTGTVLHGKVPLAATDGLNSNEVIVAPFVAWKGLES